MEPLFIIFFIFCEKILAGHILSANCQDLSRENEKWSFASPFLHNPNSCAAQLPTNGIELLLIFLVALVAIENW